jgi:hypothetical protein
VGDGPHPVDPQAGALEGEAQRRRAEVRDVRVRVEVRPARAEHPGGRGLDVGHLEDDGAAWSQHVAEDPQRPDGVRHVLQDVPQRGDVPPLVRPGEVLQASVAHVDADHLAGVAGEGRCRLDALRREAGLARLEHERAAGGAHVEQAPRGGVPAQEVDAARRVGAALGDGLLGRVVAREVPGLVPAALVEVLRGVGVGLVGPEEEGARRAADEHERRQRGLRQGRARRRAGRWRPSAAETVAPAHRSVPWRPMVPCWACGCPTAPSAALAPLPFLACPECGFAQRDDRDAEQLGGVYAEGA